VRTERPQVYFRALVKLTAALHRALGKPNDFDRRRSGWPNRMTGIQSQI
jgi:hypothetical protein